MTWSSFEKDKLLTESWRKFLHEEEQTIFGLNSKDNKDSLINILDKLAGALTPEQKTAIVNLVANAASDEDIMLEAVSLQGSKSEQDRVFSSETTIEILQGIAKLRLDQQQQKAVVKALNYWGRVNTVKFEKPAAASPAAPDEAPSKEPTVTPSSNTVSTSSEPEATTTSKNPEKEGPEFIYFFDTNRASGEVADLKSAWNQRFGKQRHASFKRDLKKFADFVGPYVNFNESDMATALSESNKFRKELKNFTKAAPGYFMDDNQFTGALIKRVEKDNSTKRIILSLLKLRGGRFNRETIRKVLSGLIANLRRRKN